MSRLILFFVITIIALPSSALAAIGCTLSNPAEDLKYLFPEMTSFKEELHNLATVDNGKSWYQKLQERLGSDLDKTYETYETPYTIYKVFKSDDLLGIVHGVNVPGKGGVIQVFLSSDITNGTILKFFFQRLESPFAKELKKKELREQFVGLNLSDFYKHDYYSVADPKNESDKISKITVTALGIEGMEDYQATLRGIRKNLVLLDFFIYHESYEGFYTKAQEGIRKLKTK